MDEPKDTIQSLRRTIESLQGENAVLRGEINAIRKSEGSYRALYDALPVSLQVVDKDGIILGVNPFHVKNMGKGRTKVSDYAGQYICTRRSIVASGLSEDFARVLQGVPFAANEVLFPALSGGGGEYFNIRGVPLMRDRDIMGAIFISMDVTDLKRAKDELQHHKERLEELVGERTTDLKNAYERLRDEDKMRRQVQEEREKLILELQEALAKVKTLTGFIPICASCKKIRDDKGFWNQIEAYLSAHSELEFSHSLCPECAHKLYPELLADQ
jgi:PAS domain-containing protein